MLCFNIADFRQNLINDWDVWGVFEVAEGEGDLNLVVE